MFISGFGNVGCRHLYLVLFMLVVIDLCLFIMFLYVLLGCGDEIIQEKSPQEGEVFVDVDNDGFLNNEDCDDADSDTYPGAIEVCDGFDNNCDGFIDETGALGEVQFFIDADEDGFGHESQSMISCFQPEGYVLNIDDCDDRDADVHPETFWFQDIDGDGYGTGDVSLQQCEAPEGYVFTDSDCNDMDAEINPETHWYRDADQDGFGTDEDMLITCAPVTGYVLLDGDCDDDNRSLSPLTTWLVDAESV